MPRRSNRTFILNSLPSDKARIYAPEKQNVAFFHGASSVCNVWILWVPERLYEWSMQTCTSDSFGLRTDFWISIPKIRFVTEARVKEKVTWDL